MMKTQNESNKVLIICFTSLEVSKIKELRRMNATAEYVTARGR